MLLGLSFLLSWAAGLQSNTRPNKSPAANECGRSVELVPDTGLVPFNFGKGNAGISIPDRFTITAPPTGRLGLMVFDCYCGGDRFVVYNDNQPSNFPILFATGTCSAATPACQGYQDDPKKCAELSYNLKDLTSPNAFFCGGATILDPFVSYDLRVEVASSPFEEGTGFIWAYTTNEDGIPLCARLEGQFYSFAECYLGIASSHQ